MTQDSFIVAARRTPIGSFLGTLSPLSAAELGAFAIQAVVSEAGIALGAIDEVLMGCVLPAGVGQAPARQAALKAGIPQSVPCTTINKMCGSGMKTVMLGHDLIKAGSGQVVIAGGMESMSNAPYLLANARTGMRIGHRQILDHMLCDGLQDPESGDLMGYLAEICAEKYGLTREQQDHYAAESVRRSIAAIESGAFGAEIIPLDVATKGKTRRVNEDEQPRKCDLTRIGHMHPAFKEGGTVTAANSSSISDGAAALLLMGAQAMAEHGLTPIARLLGHATHARAPGEFTVAPIDAIRRLQQRLGWASNDVDLYEINEAFAVVAMAALRDLELEHAKLNVNGGACALGHPIGASGARILVTLVHALRQRGLRRGIAALCIGGGEATAVGVEVI
ncbi:MAG: thiolase family protein [Gammaproteobacteria bacterium]